MKLKTLNLPFWSLQCFLEHTVVVNEKIFISVKYIAATEAMQAHGAVRDRQYEKRTCQRPWMGQPATSIPLTNAELGMKDCQSEMGIRKGTYCSSCQQSPKDYAHFFLGIYELSIKHLGLFRMHSLFKIHCSKQNSPLSIYCLQAACCEYLKFKFYWLF